MRGNTHVKAARSRYASTTGRPAGAELAKYVVIAVILVYIVLLMIYTSGSTKSFRKIEKAVEASLDTENLKKMDGQKLKRFYGLNSEDYEGVLFYSSESSVSVEEVLLVKVKSENQADLVKNAVEKRVENRKNDFAGYASKQEKLLNDAVITVRGKFVLLAVSPKAAEYKEVFAKSL